MALIGPRQAPANSRKSALDGLEDEFGAIADLELFAQRSQMQLNGCDMDAEALGDFLVCEPFLELPKDLAFPFGQLAEPLAQDRPRRVAQRRGGQVYLAGQNQFDSAHQHLSRHPLRQTAL